MCEKCDGKWSVLSSSILSHTGVKLIISPVCDSYVRPMTLVRICDECSCKLTYPCDLVSSWWIVGTTAGKCIICGSPGKPSTEVCNNSWWIAISDAYYCTECTRLEKDRDGCPKIINVRPIFSFPWFSLGRDMKLTDQLGASRVDAFYERKKLG